MLTSFPSILNKVWEKRGGVSGKRGVVGDCTGFVGVGNFSFSSLLACPASLCTFNNAVLVLTVLVIVCGVFASSNLADSFLTMAGTLVFQPLSRLPFTVCLST